MGVDLQVGEESLRRLLPRQCAPDAAKTHVDGVDLFTTEVGSAELFERIFYKFLELLIEISKGLIRLLSHA